MAASAPSRPVRPAAQPSVLLLGSAWDRPDQIVRMLTATDVVVTGAVGRPLESIDASLLDGHDAVVIACERLDCSDDLHRVTDVEPTARVIVVADPGGHRTAVRRALDAGAAGFVWSTELETALTPTILAVCAGQLAIPFEHRDELGRMALTTREKQILGLVVMGLRNGEIAEKLYLAESTVKSHLSSAFNKLDVRSRNEATALILDPASGIGPGILGIPADRIGPRG